jgi:hypothetical protein
LEAVCNETLVVHPTWKGGATPQNLRQKLQDSGQTLAARRFWPFVSPVTGFLALVNVYFAWHRTGTIGDVWLVSGLAIVLKSIATYAYFAPTMIRKFEKAETMEGGALTISVKRWTSLSPIRLCMELVGWVAAVWTWWSVAKG